MTVNLRPYQVEQVENTMYLLAQGHRSVLFEAATGTGKTRSAGKLASIVVERGGRVLFLAHRGELLTQAKKHFEDVFGLTVGIEQGSKRATDEQVVCASVQTMRGERLQGWSPDAFDLIIVDECHHAPSASYRTILDYFWKARVVGVTATVDRADGVPLGTVFGAVAHRYGIEQAIEEGFLCPIRGVQVTVPGLDLSKVRARRQIKREPVVGRAGIPFPNVVDPTGEERGETVDLLAPTGQARVARGGKRRYAVDLHPGDLRAAALAPAAVTGIVEPMLELVGDRRTIVFAVDIPHAEALATEINRRRPSAAKVVHGDTKRIKKQERLAIQAAHKAGEFQFLVNCMLLTEGYDDPAIGCVVMARPTMSRVLYVQSCGRALRLHDGKREALLLDFVGVGSKFNLVGPEDALGGALVGPVTRVSAANVAKKPHRARRWTPTTFEPEPAPAETALARPRGRYTTKVVELVRRAKKRVAGWLGRLFS